MSRRLPGPRLAPSAAESARVAALAEVGQVYADVAARPVDRQCIARTTCCQFRVTGRMPSVTRGEAILLAKGVRAAGRKEIPEAVNGACPLLHPATGKCLAYAQRPFGCRTHFCAAAGGPYAREEVLDLIRRLESADRALGGDGPHPLPVALGMVWEEAKRKR